MRNRSLGQRRDFLSDNVHRRTETSETLLTVPNDSAVPDQVEDTDIEIMSEVNPEVLRAYHEARAKETAEALMKTDAKPEAAEQAKSILQDEGPKQAAQLKSKTSCATFYGLQLDWSDGSQKKTLLRRRVNPMLAP